MDKNHKARIELLTVILLSFGVVFAVLCGVGTMFSGWHLVDDHEYAEYVYMMKYHHESILQLMHEWVKMDLSIRYRPLYYPIRILTAYIFGINMEAIAFVRGIVISLTLVFLYYCGRNMGATGFYSYLFALISMVGYQAAAWWKLGPQESFATFLLAAGFYLMLHWLKNGKNVPAVISLILFAVMSNYKESYVVVLPFLFAYVIYDTYHNKSSFHEMWENRVMLKKRNWYLISLVLIFLIVVAVIIIFVGVDGYSGAGLDPRTKLTTYISAIQNEFATDLRWYKLFTILLLAVMLTFWEELKKLWKEILLTVIFILPQAVLYAQTGFLERYILPASVGYAFFFVIVGSRWNALVGKRRKIYATFLILLLLCHTRATLVEADYYRYRGDSITTMMEEVRAMAGNDKKVLSCFSPNEESNLTIKYWMLLHDYDQVYYWHEKDKIIDREFEYDSYPEVTGASSTQDVLKDMDIVVMYNRDDRHYTYDPSLDLSEFTEVKCGTLTIYVRNNDGITIPKIDVRPSYYYAQD